MAKNRCTLIDSKVIAEACDDLKRQLLHEFREHRDATRELTGTISIRPCEEPEITVTRNTFPEAVYEWSIT